MDIEFTKKFMQDNQEQVMDLFLTYQIVEMYLFMKLHIAVELKDSNNREDSFEKINKEMDKKTIGSLKEQYKKIFPNDDYEILSKLEMVRIERNNFMHSFWIFLSTLKLKIDERQKISKDILDQYSKNVNELFDMVNKLP